MAGRLLQLESAAINWHNVSAFERTGTQAQLQTQWNEKCSGIRVQASPLVGALSTEFCMPLLEQCTGKGDGAALLTVPLQRPQTLLLTHLSQEGLG